MLLDKYNKQNIFFSSNLKRYNMNLKVIDKIKLPENEKTELKVFIQRVINEVDGKIKLIKLFGSCARNELTDDSDIDIMVVAKERSLQLFDQIENIAIDSFLRYGGRIISIKLLGEKHYEFLKELETPFIKNVEKGGITLWSKKEIWGHFPDGCFFFC